MLARLSDRTTREVLGLLLLAFFAVWTVGCGGSSGSSAPPAAPGGAGFFVVDTANNPLVDATVYLVPAGDVDQTPFDGADVRNGSSEDRDEPLEDAIRLNGAGYAKAVTNAAGMAQIPTVAAGRYFYFVAPAVADAEHLPGGCGCRVALDHTVLTGQTTDILMSTQPSPAATHVGTSTCLVCHEAYATQATHAHRLGFAVPGKLAGLQDTTRYPEFDANWNQFLPAADHTGGTKLYLYDFDSTRGFDKFKSSLTDPTASGGTVNVCAYFWQDTLDDKYKITLDNVDPMAGAPNPSQPPNLWTVTVELTYGGAVYKQRNLVSIEGRKGLYPLLQYQTEGDDSRWSRTRKQYRDYHLDWYWDDANKLFKLPASSKNFEGNCTACHSTGFTRYQDPDTMEWLSGAVSDINGAYDIDQDGTPDEINVGCEVCHGPGSEHVSWASDSANSGNEARYVVRLNYLSPSREMQICGRCHDRVQGNGPVNNDEPLNAAGEMPRPGISRATYLADFTNRKGPKASSLWSDEVHSKSHHQQYSDLIKSRKHRNDRILTVCSDCHDSHGFSPWEHHLKKDPSDPVNGLCADCHSTDLLAHMQAQTGAQHKGLQTNCSDCHMSNNSKSGSGVYGILMDVPTGESSDALIAYYQNDIHSHLFGTIPKKTHPDVAGKTPDSAMPIPYTNTCASQCHDVTGLQFNKLSGKFLQELLLGAPDAKALPAHEDDDYGN